MSETVKGAFGKAFGLAESDPEFASLFENFLTQDVAAFGDIDSATERMAVLSVLAGAQGKEAFEVLLQDSADCGVTPEMLREIVYQSVAYLGFGRAYPFILAVSRYLKDKGLLPLEKASTTTPETRLQAGSQKQVDLFGDGMRDFWKSGPQESVHINRWLAQNCFGDYYTRKGLDDRRRELITFCFLAAQGGCEPQLTSHAGANMRIGNDKTFLIAVLSRCLPYIGYPRSLNALRCINDAANAG